MTASDQLLDFGAQFIEPFGYVAELDGFDRTLDAVQTLEAEVVRLEARVAGLRAALAAALKMLVPSVDCPWAHEGDMPCIGGLNPDEATWPPDEPYPSCMMTDEEVAACWGRWLECGGGRPEKAAQ